MKQKTVLLGMVTPDSLWAWVTGQQEEPTESEEKCVESIWQSRMKNFDTELSDIKPTGNGMTLREFLSKYDQSSPKEL